MARSSRAMTGSGVVCQRLGQLVSEGCKPTARLILPGMNCRVKQNGAVVRLTQTGEQ